MPTVLKLKLYFSSYEIYADGYLRANIISAKRDLISSFGAAYFSFLFLFFEKYNQLNHVIL